jgi:hypothetical protein
MPLKRSDSETPSDIRVFCPLHKRPALIKVEYAHKSPNTDIRHGNAVHGVVWLLVEASVVPSLVLLNTFVSLTSFVAL